MRRIVNNESEKLLKIVVSLFICINCLLIGHLERIGRVASNQLIFRQVKRIAGLSN